VINLTQIPKDFVNKLYKLTELTLGSKSKNLNDYIVKYTDKNNETLFDLAPNKRLFFTEQDKAIMFFCTGLQPAEITKVIKENDFIDSSWQILSNPFNIASVMAIRYFTINKKHKELENAIMYLTYFFYASIHFKYFKYEPQPNIMAYTVNNLSNKYLIKQTGTLFEAMKITSMKCHETYEKNIISCNDLELKNYIVAFRSRLDSLVQNIAKEYYNNRDQGLYLNTEEDNYSDTNYHLNDNTSFQITELTNKVLIKIVSKNVDTHLVNLSAKMCGVSVNVTRTALSEIIRKKNSDIKELIELILQLFLAESKNGLENIGSKYFVNYCLEIYIKSNTTDKTIIRIKELLDQWLSECSENYRKTERLATLNNFRKAIYIYFVLSIQQIYLS